MGLMLIRLLLSWCNVLQTGPTKKRSAGVYVWDGWTHFNECFQGTSATGIFAECLEEKTRARMDFTFTTEQLRALQRQMTVNGDILRLGQMRLHQARCLLQATPATVRHYRYQGLYEKLWLHPFLC